MPFNGSGTFTRLYSWTNDAAAAVKIRADRMDAEMDGLATGLSACLTRDGQGKPTAAINWNGQNLTNVATFAAASGSFTTPLAVASGGTGLAAVTQGGLVYASGAAALASTAAGTSGQLLKSGGTGAPTWGALTSSEVTTALGFTPYNATNPNGYITSSSLTWANISGRPTAVSSFTNDSGYITSSGSCAAATNATSASQLGGYSGSISNAGSTVPIRDGSGYLYATDYYVASDARLKTDVERIDGGEALAGIRACLGWRYTKEMDGTAPVRELGVIAQHIQQHFPEQVTVDADGFLHVGNLVGPIFAALAHLADRCEAAGVRL